MLVMFDPEHNGPTGNRGWQTEPASLVRFDTVRLSDVRVPHQSNPERPGFGQVRTVPPGVARLVQACRSVRAVHCLGRDETEPRPVVGPFDGKRRTGVESARRGCHGLRTARAGRPPWRNTVWSVAV